jgi:hypothetical protein
VDPPIGSLPTWGQTTDGGSIWTQLPQRAGGGLGQSADAPEPLLQAGNAGLELHFAIDWRARTLQVQLNHPPSDPTHTADAPVGAEWNKYARAMRLTPSEVLTVPLPANMTAESYRPAVMIRGPITPIPLPPRSLRRMVQTGRGGGSRKRVRCD